MAEGETVAVYLPKTQVRELKQISDGSHTSVSSIVSRAVAPRLAEIKTQREGFEHERDFATEGWLQQWKALRFPNDFIFPVRMPALDFVVDAPDPEIGKWDYAVGCLDCGKTWSGSLELLGREVLDSLNQGYLFLPTFADSMKKAYQWNSFREIPHKHERKKRSKEQPRKWVDERIHIEARVRREIQEPLELAHYNLWVNVKKLGEKLKALGVTEEGDEND